MKTKLNELTWFLGGALVGFTALTLASASVPKRSLITNDTVLYQNLSEIRVKRTEAITADSEIARLAHLERNYQTGLVPKAPRVIKKRKNDIDEELDRLD
jgi:hypothetical protein